MDGKNKNENTPYQVLLPSDTETEETVLGTLIRRNELYAQVDDILTPESFRSESNAVVFRCIRWIIKSGKIADVNSIVEAAKSHKSVVKVAVDEARVFVIASHFSEYTFLQDVERLVNFARRRKAWTELQLLSQKVVDLTEDVDVTLDELQKDVEYLKGMGAVDANVLDARTALTSLNGVVQQNLSGESPMTVRTGFKFTDNKGGLRLGELTVVAAFSGIGKTSLALCMAVNMAFNRVPVAYYSLEMNSTELWSRIISGPSGMTSNDILTSRLSKERLEKFDKAVASYMDIPLFIDESATISFEKVLRSIRTLAIQKGVKVFYIDYLQIFLQNKNGEREESALSSMVRRLKNLCKELSLCGVVLSQLRRDKEETHPRMDMLRGSGQIEESADNVVLIDRPAARPEWGVFSYRGYNSNVSIRGTAEISVSKGRNVGTGTWIVGFNGDNTRFYDLDEIPYKTKSNKQKKDGESDGQDAVPEAKPETATQTALPFPTEEQGNAPY